MRFPIYPHFCAQKRALWTLFCSTRIPQHENMFSLQFSSSNVSSISVSSSLKSSSSRRHQTRPRRIVTKAADVMREGNDLRRRQRRGRGEEEHEEEKTKTRRRREVLKILPSGVALATMAIGGFATCTTAQPSFAAGASGEQKLSSIEEKELAKERRKAAVRGAAERAKETGVGGNAFSDSEYMVGEDHSPNAHSHQEEGSKGSFV